MEYSMLPPGPTTGKLKQFIKFIRHPIDLFEQCRQQYGKIFTLKMAGQPPYVVICDPADIKQIFTTHGSELNTGEINGSILKPVLGDYSLLTLDGAKHLQHRKLMLPPFHGNRMQVYGETMARLTKLQLKSWQPGTAFPIYPHVLDITFQVILSTVFGIDEKNKRFASLHQLLHDLMHIIKTPYGLITLLNKKLHIKLGPLTPWSKICSLRERVDEQLCHEIEERKGEDLTKRTDILSLLLQARDENGQPMTTEEIRDEMITLLIAGHETSATGISWVFYHILSNPDVYQRVKQELKAEQWGKEVSHNANRLTYLDGVIKETLRMLPIVPYIARLTQTEYQLGEYRLPKGVAIVPAIYLAHHEAANWEQPQAFNPHRFIHNKEKPFTFLPFGGGMRRCIGTAFAQYEMKIILAEVLSQTELELQAAYQPKLIRRGVVMAPSAGVPIILKEKL